METFTKGAKEMINNLLIISCSQCKVSTPGVLPAIDRYDGPTYRTLRKFCPDGLPPLDLDVVIISAKYGFLRSKQLIENYDRRMTAKRADELRPKVQARLKELIQDKSECPFSLGAYDQVFINLGKTYMRTLEGFHWGLLSTLEASGGIGQKTSQMKAWLERIYQN